MIVRICPRLVRVVTCPHQPPSPARGRGDSLRFRPLASGFHFSYFLAYLSNPAQFGLVLGPHPPPLSSPKGAPVHGRGDSMQPYWRR